MVVWWYLWLFRSPGANACHRQISHHNKCLWCPGQVQSFQGAFSFDLVGRCTCIYKPSHDKTNKVACTPREGSDQPGHPPSLIRVFAVRMKKAWVLSYPVSVQRRLWSDWADAQADLSLRWAQSHFVGFVTRWLICIFCGVYVATVPKDLITDALCPLHWQSCQSCKTCQQLCHPSAWMNRMTRWMKAFIWITVQRNAS